MFNDFILCNLVLNAEFLKKSYILTSVVPRRTVPFQRGSSGKTFFTGLSMNIQIAVHFIQYLQYFTQILYLHFLHFIFTFTLYISFRLN